MLCCAVLFYVMLHCDVLYCIVLCWTELCCDVLCCVVLYYAIFFVRYNKFHLIILFNTISSICYISPSHLYSILIIRMIIILIYQRVGCFWFLILLFLTSLLSSSSTLNSRKLVCFRILCRRFSPDITPCKPKRLRYAAN